MTGKKADYLENIQSNILRIRKEKGLSQRQVADRAGVQQNQLSRLESQSYDPRISAIYKASEALEVPIQELFRIHDPSNLEADQLIARIFEMEDGSRKPLLKVIEAYLKNYEATVNFRTPPEERMRQLEETIKLKESEKG